MGDRFLNVTGALADPGYDAITVVIGTAFSYTARALYIGSVGDVSVITAAGNTVIFPAVPTGTVLPIRCTKVNTSGTTASSIVAFT